MNETMKRPISLIPCALAMGGWAFCSPVSAESPRSAPKEATQKPAATPAPPLAPSPNSGADGALARWLAQTPSGHDAIQVPFAQVVTAATGKRVLPFDPADPVDAATLAKIGSALDALLPKMNQPDSSARTAVASGGEQAVCARFEGELRAALPSPPLPAVGAPDSTYPTVLVTDAATGKAYYLAVTLCPTADAGSTMGAAVIVRPDAAASRMNADGCCLLVSIEHNGKIGRDIAFLNWRVLDLSKTKTRFAPTFQAGGQDALQPGAILTDGRKGRD